MLLKKLSEIDGVSASEDRVRDIIIEEIKDYADKIKIDKMGNLIVFKKGNSKNKKRIMVAAHMDEVGFMIKSIDDNGLMGFLSVGNIDKRVLIGKRVVVGKEKISGVINYKPVHMQKKDYKNIPEMDQLFIDIGATDKKDCEKYASIGDYATFDTKFEQRGKIIKGKAFDDRIGCFSIIELFKRKMKNDLFGTFFVQEEVGLRGSITAARSVDPEYAVILEVTSAADMPHEKDEADFPKFGKGVVITISDRTFFADRDFLETAKTCATVNKIPHQFKQPMIGGTDAGSVHVSRSGIKTLVFSVPARYIHSPVSYAHTDDINGMIDLSYNLINTIK